MADKDEGQTTTPRGADWEVVSLTASAYAAAPGGYMTEFKHEEMSEVSEKDKVESSNALFMSGHFVLPSSKHANKPSESEKTEILDQEAGKDYGYESVKHVSGKHDSKEEENWNLMNLANADFTKDSTLSGLNISEKEQSIYGSPMLHSLHNEATIGALNINDETNVLDESIQSSDPILDSNTSFPTKEDNHEGSGTPYSAWLKKQAVSLYAHAKETNAFWSVFAVAAVMGIVIIGRRWQQERWQGLRHELKSKVNDEKMRMMAGPVSRFKDAIVGNHRQDFAVRGSIFQEL